MASGEPGGEKPGEGQKPGEGEKPSQAEDGRPLHGGATDDPNPTNNPDGLPPKLATEVVGVDPQAGRWGSLPAHAQATFSSRGSDDLPARYRDWIDAYHRRLNRDE